MICISQDLGNPVLLKDFIPVFCHGLVNMSRYILTQGGSNVIRARGVAYKNLSSGPVKQSRRHFIPAAGRPPAFAFLSDKLSSNKP